MIQYKDLTAGPNFFLMAGPCAIEDEDTPLFIAERIVEMTTRLGIPYIFKGSYRKANRSRVDSFTGIGDEKALRILRRVRETFDIPVVTDIHETQEAALAAEYVDVLQIPAFLCRQTDLIAAAARTGKIVNIKKGQFLSASGMEPHVRSPSVATTRSSSPSVAIASATPTSSWTSRTSPPCAPRASLP